VKTVYLLAIKQAKLADWVCLAPINWKLRNMSLLSNRLESIFQGPQALDSPKKQVGEF